MRVSVIVPCFNHERYVAACLAAICAQDWDDLEVIVLDDGSTDGTWAAIERFTPPPTVRFERSTGPNRGASVTLNAGLVRATGDYVTICNSDDLFSPGRIRTLVDALREGGARFAFSRVRCIDAKGRDVTDLWPYARSLARTQDRIAQAPAIGFALALSNVAISTGNFFFERSLLQTVGGFRPYKLVHDWDFILRVLLETEPLFVDEPLYEYRLHSNNSFTSLLGSVAAVECPELMRRFLKAATLGQPHNERCPSPRNWPGYFEAFIEEHAYEPYLAQWDTIDGPAYPLGAA